MPDAEYGVPANLRSRETGGEKMKTSRGCCKITSTRCLSLPQSPTLMYGHPYASASRTGYPQLSGLIPASARTAASAIGTGEISTIPLPPVSINW